MRLLATLLLLAPVPALAGTFADTFDDGVLAPWVSVHGTNVDDGTDLVGSGYADHISPSAVVDPGIPAGSSVTITALATRVGGTEYGFTLKRDGAQFCGFYVIDVLGDSYLFWTSDVVTELVVEQIDSMTPDQPYEISATLDSASGFVLWVDGVEQYTGAHPFCGFAGAGEVGTLHHVDAESRTHEFTVTWGSDDGDGAGYCPGALCNAVLDLTGDCRDEVVVWDPHEIWVYTQEDNPKEGRLYKPVRNPLYNTSNYQATVSLPGWSE